MDYFIIYNAFKWNEFYRWETELLEFSILTEKKKDYK